MAVTVAEADLGRLAEAVEALPLGVVVVDDEGRVVVRNRRATAMTGDRASDVLVSAVLDELVTGARRQVGQDRTLELHGPPRTLHLLARPLASGGAVAVVEDTSERRQLDAVRRDFVANVSHELRTPIGALGVLADTLREEQDADVTRRLADRISVEAERAGQLISELLDLSRLEAGGLQRRARVIVAEVVDAATRRVLPLAERHEVPLRVLPVPDDLAVDGDVDQLVSAVANVVDNAVKYSDAGDPVEVAVTRGGGWVDVVVRDHGVGIPARDLDRVFERFYRVDRARDRRTGGTGLGLAIVRHAVVNHGGEVLVVSEEGVGSTFTLRLPEGGPPPS